MASPATRVLQFISLPLLWAACLVLTVGLTYAPCYSSLCVEEFFPSQTRRHIGIYYGLLAGAGIFLSLRAFWASFRSLSEFHLCDVPVPFVGKRLSVGALILFVWIAGLSFGATGLWLPAENMVWMAKGVSVDWTMYIFRGVWTGVTGHWIDIWIGLVILPIGRNSILAKCLRLHTSTLLVAHKLIAYALLVGGLIHGFLSYSFLAAWVQEEDNEAILDEFTPDNPLLTASETEAKGIYANFCLPTGALVGIILIPAMTITALPALRNRFYNAFYFTHVILAVLTMVFVCIHASTNFYFILPGLVLWIADWTWRVINALGVKAEVQLENAGEGWYRIRLPSKVAVPALESDVEVGSMEKGQTIVKRAKIPLQTYQINLGQISKFQVHAFTVACDATEDAGPVLLLRKGPERTKAKSRDKEWTWKLAALADAVEPGKPTALQARIEGPYFPQTENLYAADHIIAIVGGTGVTGAISLAQWWLDLHAGESSSAKSFSLIWTVRHRDHTQVQEVLDLQALLKDVPNMSSQIHVSAESGRLDSSAALSHCLEPGKGKRGRAWVYTSGPPSLMADVEVACVKQRNILRGDRKDLTSLEWYSATYST